MGVQAAAAIGRSRALRGALTASPSIDPWTAEFADSGTSHAGGCPEIDCVRSLLAAEVIDAAEHRAAALNARMTRSLVELERHLSALKESGNLPTLAPDHPESTTDRQPHSRVAA
jgi:hypothetical protein